MSVINKMLRDLDRRNAPREESNVLSQQLRPGEAIPMAKKRSNLLVSMAGLAVLGGGGYFAWNTLMTSPPAPPAIAQAPRPVAQPVTQPVAPKPAAAAVAQVQPQPAAPQSVAQPTPTPPPPMQVAAVAPTTMTDVSARSPAQSPVVTDPMPSRVTGAPGPRAAPKALVPPPPRELTGSKPTPRAVPSPRTAPSSLDELIAMNPVGTTSTTVVAKKPAARPARVVADDPNAIDKNFTNSPKRDADAALTKAVTFLQQGRVDEAVEGIRKVLAMEPGHEIARQTIVALMIEQGRTPEAQSLLAEALAINPGQSQFAMMLGRLTLNGAGPEPALAVLAKYADAGRDNAQYRGLVAAILQRLGKHSEAVQEYGAALTLAPHMGAWWMGLGISQQSVGAANEAAASYQRAKSSGTLNADLVAFVDDRLKQITK